MAKQISQTITSIQEDIISITYKGRRYRINITKELQINENIINNQLKELPSNYAFLQLLRDYYVNKRNKLQKEMETSYHNAWVYYKESGSISNDLAEHKAASNAKYLSICKRYEKINYKTTKLFSVCKAYETRERIIQSLNANLRKQQ